MEFVNLHNHTYYSILEGMMSPKDLLKIAQKKGQKAVAITDRGVGYGMVDFFQQAQKIGGIKPILGVEIFVSQDSHFEKRPGIDGNEGNVVLLATSNKGFKNILELISIGHLEGFFEKPRVDFPSLKKYSEDIICLTGTDRGVIGESFYDFGEKKALESLKKLKNIFGKNLFLEINAKKTERQTDLNHWKLEQSKQQKIEFVITSESRFGDIGDETAAETLYRIGKNQNFGSDTSASFMSGAEFKSWEEIKYLLSDWMSEDFLEKGRVNTLKINDLIDFELEFGKDLLPHFELEEGQTEKKALRKNCDLGFGIRFKKEIKNPDKFPEFDPKNYEERLTYELSIIGKMGFEAYFLIVQDLIDFAKKNKISVGPGRGSAAGSLVSYLLGITNVDPIKYDLLFERFLNPERISMPDIDIDFSDERRGEVLEYVIEKYGEARVSKVCTFGTLAAKAALKDVGRVYEIPYGLMNEMTKLLPNTPGFKLTETKEIHGFDKFLEKHPELQMVFEIALKLEGCVRHVSVHACAVIIGNDTLSKFAPIQWAPGTELVKITQFPYEQLEALGLLKMDFLGLKNLSIIEKTMDHVNHNTKKISEKNPKNNLGNNSKKNFKKDSGKVFDLTDIPMQDTKTFETVFAAGETTGVFQFESAGMRRYLKELKPTEFEDLVAMNALYRPGPMEYIPQYIKGKHDPKSVKYPHPDLKNILEKTYGIAVYQEQILRIARDFAGFSLGEADILRKAIGKKIISILNEQRKKFVDGVVKNGHQKKMGEKIFDDIVVPFSGYGFNRSHAFCYALIAYQTAYLRAHYPVEFMAGVMTTDRNNTDRIVLEMGECKKMEIEVLPPSINESGSFFTVVA